MALFEAIDERRTQENVRLFFEHDFPKIQQQAHVSFVDVKSPIISGMPSAGHYDNVNDEKYTMHAQAIQYLNAVLDACRGMDSIHRLMIELRYFKRLKWLAIEEQAHISKRRGQELLNESLMSFAFGFADTMELRVFESDVNGFKLPDIFKHSKNR